VDLPTAQRILADAAAYDRDLFVQAYLLVQQQHIQGGEHVKDWYLGTTPDGEDTDADGTTSSEGDDDM
jgi:hypothetical protein